MWRAIEKEISKLLRNITLRIVNKVKHETLSNRNASTVFGIPRSTSQSKMIQNHIGKVGRWPVLTNIKVEVVPTRVEFWLDILDLTWSTNFTWSILEYFVPFWPINHLLTDISPSHVTGFLLYPLKTSEKQWFPNVFRGYRKKLVAWNGLKGSMLKYLKKFWKSLANNKNRSS